MAKTSTRKTVTTDAETVAEAITAAILPGLAETVYSSGSTGFRSIGKVAIGPDRYQVTVMAVLIGSKPQGKVKAA